jgi:peptidoglycan/LPS O-acetylase OafA/YrhL
MAGSARVLMHEPFPPALIHVVPMSLRRRETVEYGEGMAGGLTGRRIPELDSLRAIAALLIVGFHNWIRVAFFGWVGVNLFFVLSGYLITSIILDNLHVDRFVLKFYMRRSLRIWPIYYLLLFVLLFLNEVVLRGPAGARYPIDGLANYLTYTQNVQAYWFGAIPPFLAPSWFVHTWTLAIEEQFYLIWPATVVLTGRRALIPVSLVFTALAVWARAFGFHQFLLLSQVDALALGGLLAALLANGEWVRSHVPMVRRGLSPVGIGAFVFLLWSHLPHHARSLAQNTWTMLAVNVLFFAAVGLAVIHTGRPLLAPLRLRALRYLGQISYGVYLYHVPVMHWLKPVILRALPRHDQLVNVLVLIPCFAVAVISWELVEKPLLRLKDRFRYRAPMDQTSGGIPNAASPVMPGGGAGTVPQGLDGQLEASNRS